MKKKIINEELSKEDEIYIKDTVNRQLRKLFYSLYVKNAFWVSK